MECMLLFVWIVHCCLCGLCVVVCVDCALFVWIVHCLCGLCVVVCVDCALFVWSRVGMC